MKWIKEKSNELHVPIMSWCDKVEPLAMEQARNLANHPIIFHHVALMPDCHCGYGMPIGGVIAANDAVIPNAVGVDIGCGMIAVRTSLTPEKLQDMALRADIHKRIKTFVPVGEGHSHRTAQSWDKFQDYLDTTHRKMFVEPLDRANLGTLGGGNHFLEVQKGDDGFVWIMIHSGSRNLGARIATYYHKKARELNARWHSSLPTEHLAFLPMDDTLGQDYLTDMNWALAYALENRHRMMTRAKEVFAELFNDVTFDYEVNIHHNYAAIEHHFGHNVYVHRKGATSARKGQIGIIPGSMGTSSYIVRGLGNSQSFQSCSHGAGRKMSRIMACQILTQEQCDKDMDGIVHDPWGIMKTHSKNKATQKFKDFSEAPAAYKDIDDVIASELDLIEPLVKLKPLLVIKG